MNTIHTPYISHTHKTFDLILLHPLTFDFDFCAPR